MSFVTEHLKLEVQVILFGLFYFDAYCALVDGKSIFWFSTLAAVISGLFFSVHFSTMNFFVAMKNHDILCIGHST